MKADIKMTPPEKIVAQYFTEKSFKFKPQFPVCVYDEDKRLRIWYPDFYIPKLGLYIEVCGSEQVAHEYYRREQIYINNGV